MEEYFQRIKHASQRIFYGAGGLLLARIYMRDAQA